MGELPSPGGAAWYVLAKCDELFRPCISQDLSGCVCSAGGFYLSWCFPYNSEGDGAKSGKGGAEGNLINWMYE